METAKLMVEGMGCGACVAKVKKALAGTPGVVVDEVTVGSAAVRRDPSQVSDAAILESLSRAGYRATLEAERGNDRTCCGTDAR